MRTHTVASTVPQESTHTRKRKREREREICPCGQRYSFPHAARERERERESSNSLVYVGLSRRVGKEERGAKKLLWHFIYLFILAVTPHYEDGVALCVFLFIYLLPLSIYIYIYIYIYIPSDSVQALVSLYFLHKSYPGPPNQILEALQNGRFGDLTYEVTRQNVNYIDPKNRMSLLMWAVALGRLPTVELLLAKGATIFPLDALGFTVLHRAVWVGDVSIVRALLFLSPESRVPQRSPFSPKGSNAEAEAVVHEWITDRAAAARQTAGRVQSASSSSPPGSRGRTGTRSGAGCVEQQQQQQEEGGEEVSVFTRWLVAEGNKQLEVDALGGEALSGPPPLQWRPGAKQLVNVVHPSTGRTALMLAAVRGSAHIVDFLVNVCDADIFYRDQEGFTAVDLAALCGHLSILKIFLAKADGDGTGRAYPSLQQRAEEFGETAKTIPQRNILNEMNRLLAVDFSRQSYVSAC
eukprot:gene3830-2710_t